MRITSLQLHPLTVDRQYGTTIAQEGGKPRRTVSESHFYFLEVQADAGITGWGEISDIEPDELPDPKEYEEVLRKFLTGRNAFEIQRMHRDFAKHFHSGQPVASASGLTRCTSCALEMALYDIQGKATGRPIYDLLGGKVRDGVTISWVAYIREELDLLCEEIRERTAQGFTAFKLKVGVDIELDERRLAAVREVAGPEASIKVDANEGWSVSEAAANIARLAKYDLAGVESPVPRADPADIAAVRKHVGVPILEHVADTAYGLALIQAEAVEVFNVATTGCGGIWPARQVAALAEAAGLGVLIGSTVEMGPGTLAQLHLAAATPNLTLPSDLVGPGLYRDDVLVSPLRYQQGRLAIPGGPGLGMEVDRAKLTALAGS